MISSKTDPISKPKDIPWEEIKSNPNIIYVYTPRGAHLEFMVGRNRKRWYKPVMSKFLNMIDDYSNEENIQTE